MRLVRSATFVAAVAAASAAVLVGAPLPAAGATAAAPALPQHLRDTGLYVAGSTTTVRADVLAVTPLYPLWSDGAAKQRWLSLPPGTFIDASRPDAWVFPPGTRLWKEFAHGGRRVETRYIERRADGRWRYAAYVWNEDGSDAVLAPATGLPALAVAQAPGGRYAVPSRNDCLACHESAATPVLGVSAVQLAAVHDAAAVEPRGPDLNALLQRGWLRRLPQTLLAQPPRLAAASASERAALGYLHANCGHCHNDNGAPAPVPLVLAQRVGDAAASRARVLASTVGATSRFRSAALPGLTQIVAPGRPASSLLVARMRSRHAVLQMPPLGTALPDPEGLALVERWIANDLSPTHDLSTTKELAP